MDATDKQGAPVGEVNPIEDIRHEQRLAPDRVGAALLSGRMDRDPGVRAEVLRHLPDVALKEPEWRDFVRRAFTDRDYAVRSEAAAAAARLGLSEAIPDLIRLLSDRNFLVRVEAVEALWDLRATESAPHLRELLERDPHRLGR